MSPRIVKSSDLRSLPTGWLTPSRHFGTCIAHRPPSQSGRSDAHHHHTAPRPSRRCMMQTDSTGNVSVSLAWLITMCRTVDALAHAGRTCGVSSDRPSSTFDLFFLFFFSHIFSSVVLGCCVRLRSLIRAFSCCPHGREEERRRGQPKTGLPGRLARLEQRRRGQLEHQREGAPAQVGSETAAACHAAVSAVVLGSE